MQAQLFDVCGMEELVEAAVDGYNVTIFAFGQTGSGKTHTMLGPRLGRLGDGLLDPAQAARYGHHYHQQHHAASSSSGEGAAPGSAIGEEEGVVLRCLHQQYKLLDAWAAEHPGGVWGVEVSCCEIYNETITDMLGHDKTRQLQVRGEVHSREAALGDLLTRFSAQRRQHLLGSVNHSKLHHNAD